MNLFTFHSSLVSLKRILNRYGGNNARTIYSYNGPVGEAFCILGDSDKPYNYYCKNFTGINKYRYAKKTIHSLIGSTRLYKLLANNYLFVVSKHQEYNKHY